MTTAYAIRDTLVSFESNDMCIAQYLIYRGGGFRWRAKILEAVAKSFHVTADDLKSASRHTRHTIPRFAACLMLREEGRMSYPQIGRMLGGRDHSTIIYAVRRARQLLLDDPGFADAYQRACR